jgi:hypothetical protein
MTDPLFRRFDLGRILELVFMGWGGWDYLIPSFAVFCARLAGMGELFKFAGWAGVYDCVPD